MFFRDDITLEAHFSPISDNGGKDVVSGNAVSANTVTETLTVDGEAYTVTYVNKIIYDGRKHLAYAGGLTVSNTNKKAYDLPVVIKDRIRIKYERNQ